VYYLGNVEQLINTYWFFIRSLYKKPILFLLLKPSFATSSEARFKLNQAYLYIVTLHSFHLGFHFLAYWGCFFIVKIFLLTWSRYNFRKPCLYSKASHKPHSLLFIVAYCDNSITNNYHGILIVFQLANQSAQKYAYKTLIVVSFGIHEVASYLNVFAVSQALLVLYLVRRFS